MFKILNSEEVLKELLNGRDEEELVRGQSKALSDWIDEQIVRAILGENK